MYSYVIKILYSFNWPFKTTPEEIVELKSEAFKSVRFPTLHLSPWAGAPAPFHGAVAELLAGFFNMGISRPLDLCLQRPPAPVGSITLVSHHLWFQLFLSVGPAPAGRHAQVSPDLGRVFKARLSLCLPLGRAPSFLYSQASRQLGHGFFLLLSAVQQWLPQWSSPGHTRGGGEDGDTVSCC